VEVLLTSFAADPKGHPSATEIEELFLSPWVPEADRPAVRHLVDRCPACSEVTAGLWARRFAAARDEALSEELVQAPSRIERSFSEILDRVQGRAVQAQADFAAEKAEAANLLPRLLDQPLERQIILAANSRRFQTWSVCEALLDEAWGSRFREPRRTEALCRVAVNACAGLPADRYGSALTHDFQARCWIGLANGRRIVGDLRGAQTALIEAQRLLAAGTGNALEKAGWLDIRASLLVAQRKYREAEECIGRAIQVYFRFREKHALGSALIKRGLISEAIEQADRAIVLSRVGLELVDPERDPSLVLGAWLNLSLSLHTAGRDRDALAALAQARPLYLRSDDRTTVLRFQWLEGSIASSLGRDEQAEGCLREAREGFIHVGAALEAALVSLDLVGLHLRQGRTAEVRELAAQMIEVFESLDSRQEALAAFILLRQAAERDRVTEALLKRLSASLRGPQARG
jgi:tetratricopeptide (TPR) repeat protein